VQIDMGTGTANSGALGDRQHGRGDACGTGHTEWWCRWCGKKVLLVGGTGLSPEDRKAVHADTGYEHGDLDRHNAAPQNYEPPLWKSARILTAEFGGAFEIGARFNFLRADWAGAGVAEHFEADTEDEMRTKLRNACRSAGLEPPVLATMPRVTG
jgi:hypothetical protein